MRWSNPERSPVPGHALAHRLAGGLSALHRRQAVTQDAVGRPNAPSPAQGHVAVIAHGVEQFQAREVAWQIAAERAALPSRPRRPTARRALSWRTPAWWRWPIATVCSSARVAPGEADWIPPDRQTAIVSLEQRATSYFAIALLPAADVSVTGAAVASRAFTLPRNATFDVVLLRDALNRNDESEIDTGDVPGLLLVTDGTVTVEEGNGEMSISRRVMPRRSMVRRSLSGRVARWPHLSSRNSVRKFPIASRCAASCNRRSRPWPRRRQRGRQFRRTIPTPTPVVTSTPSATATAMPTATPTH